jgi:hypothetical protein
MTKAQTNIIRAEDCVSDNVGILYDSRDWKALGETGKNLRIQTRHAVRDERGAVISTTNL